MNKLKKINVLALVIAFSFLLVAATGLYSITRYTSGHHIADSRNPNATGTPVLMVNGIGDGVILELRDNATPVFQVPNGGGVIMASGFDLNGQSLTWDADADTISVTSLDDVITTTIGAATGRFHILTGNLAVGNGVNDVALNGEDGYIEGTFEVDGLVTADGGIDLNASTLTLDADADTTIVSSADDVITTTLGAAAGRFDLLVGNFKVGDGTPDITLDGENAYVEGTLEIDGLATLDGGTDVNGVSIIIDANGNSSLTADTDDQLDIELGGQDEYILTAAVLDLGEGTLTRIDLDADGDTSLRSSADDQIEVEVGTADEFIFTAGIFDIGNGTLGRIDLDADNDTSIRSSVDDQLDIELAGADQVVLKAVAGVDSATTNEYTEVALTTPVDTTGTNQHNLITCDVAIGDSTGGANIVTCLQIDPITDDAQVNEKAIVIGDEWDIAIDTNSPILATAQTWWDDFLGSTVLAMYTEVSGSDGQALQTIVEEQFGVYQLTSGDVGSNPAADLEGVYLSLEWQANQGSLVFETRLHLDTDVLTVELCAGFSDDVSTVELPFTNSADTVTAVADDAIMFCYDTGATTDEWWVNGASAGTEATGIAATGVAPAGDVYQTLRIEIDDGGADCRFYVDGTLVGTLTANCVTNTDLLAPGVVISSGGNAGSNIVDIDYLYASAGRD
jgi:hypothetical protein